MTEFHDAIEVAAREQQPVRMPVESVSIYDEPEESFSIYDVPSASAQQLGPPLEQTIYDQPSGLPGESGLASALLITVRDTDFADPGRLAQTVLQVILPHLLSASEVSRAYRFRLGNGQFHVIISRMTEENPPHPQRAAGPQPPGEAVIELSLEQVIDRCRKIDQGINEDHARRKDDLQTLLNDLGGKSFGSLHANKIVAAALQSLAEKLGYRFACPRQIKEQGGHGEQQTRTCGEPATLGCKAVTGNRNGLFYFQHPLESGAWEMHASAAVIPDHPTLVPAPLNRRKRHVPSQPSAPRLG